MTKTILLLFSIFLLFLVIPQISSAQKLEEYVSIECPDGDIKLTLSDDNSFRLEKKFWDEKTKQHTHSESLAGNWRRRGRDLFLILPNSELYYQETSDELKIANHKAKLKAYRWMSSSSPSFTDRIDLFEKEKLDSFLIEALKSNSQ